jgi:penicillin G amidase
VRRVGSFVAIGIFAVVAAIITIATLAYAIEVGAPSEVRLDGLSGEAVIGWDGDIDIIRADSDDALYAALGYSHGIKRSWSATLWRQAALAGLSSWFGSELAEVDSLALQVGLASGAREAFRRLSSEDQAILRAYALGMNRALDSRSVRLQDEYSVLGVRPERWEPWHALAVERLYAYLATEDIVDTLGTGGASDVLSERSDRLRRFLGAGNYHHSAAWVGNEPGQPRLRARFVSGSSSKPFLTEHVLVRNDDTLHVSSVPGAVVFPMGASSRHAWAIMPTSTVSLVSVASDTSRLPIVHDRIIDREGNEYLVTFRRSADGLEIGQGIARTEIDTLGNFVERRVSNRLVWGGFANTSDIGAWRALLDGTVQTFSLTDASGILLTPDGASLIGQPGEASASVSGVLAVGPPRWVRYLAESVARERDSDDLQEPEDVFDETYSAWAASLAPGMIAGARSIPEPPRHVRDALTYLRNWDFRYDESSIPATLFDKWIGHYRAESGREPEIAESDTLFTERFLRYRTLLDATEELGATFGDEMSQWRWGNVMLDKRFAPGWPGRTEFPETPQNRRFIKLEFPGHGHPSSPAYGPSPLDGGERGSAVWEAVAEVGPSMEVRRRLIDMRSFAGRYMVSDRPPSFVLLRETVPSRFTRIQP